MFSKFIFKASSLTLLAFVFVACNKDDNSDFPRTYTDGVFIIEQGGIADTKAEVTHYHPDAKHVSRNIFQLENAGAVLGSIAQSMAVHAGRAFIVVNNSNKVQVVDEESFRSVGVITGVDLPRHIVIGNHGKGFISYWGADGLSGGVAVFDLSTLQIEKRISAGLGCDQMVIDANHHLYVANSGGYGYDNTVAILDVNPGKYELLEKITVSDGPSALQLLNDDVFVLCQGYFDPAIGSLTPGALARIRDKKVVGMLTNLQGVVANLVVRPVNETPNNYEYFYSTWGGTYKAKGASLIQELPLPEKFSEKSFYALGYDSKSGFLYGGDARDFNSNGQVFIMNDAGAIRDSFQVGIVPGFFYFQ